MIPSGILDRVIKLQDRASGINALGEPSGAWNDTATVWANYSPVRGTESFMGNQKYASAEAKFIIRYRTGVTARTRIIYDGKTWDILGVEEIGRQEGLAIVAKAGANG